MSINTFLDFSESVGQFDLMKFSSLLSYSVDNNWTSCGSVLICYLYLPTALLEYNYQYYKIYCILDSLFNSWKFHIKSGLLIYRVLKDNKLVNLKAESFRGLPNLDLLWVLLVI